MHSTCPVLIAKNACHFAKLLVCIDGSNHSFKTLDCTAKLAKNMGSKITLLNVQERRLGASYSKVARELGERIFLKALGTVGDIEPKTDKKLEFGVPSDTIVEVAQKGNYDLIVLGKRGLGNVKRFLLGSVSDDVANNAKCSVMIVPTEA
jgi:nucleotide-binding universal stress UspA family protein